MAASGISSALQIILPKKRGSDKGVGYTPTYNANSPTTVLSRPTYTDHTTDIFESRAGQNSNELLQSLFKHDPDVSATVNAYLTVASSAEPWWIVYDEAGVIDREGHKTLDMLLQSLFGKVDYSVNFQLKPNMAIALNELRYTTLLRGVVMGEIVLNKAFMPSELRHVDPTKIEWFEQTPGQYKPQLNVGSGTPVPMDIPNFFVSFYNRDPSSIYAHSHFVAAINTIAARQQIVNDLYRIMKKTGYPRQSIKVVEEVLRKNAPEGIKLDIPAMNTWMTERMREIASAVTDLSVNQVYVHTDSIEPGMLNEKAPGMEMDVSPIIEVLNAQNQAALKSMATVIGRGESGVNTASVESRIFSMHADALNTPIAAFMSEVLTFCLRMTGSTSRVEFGFEKVELRPALELESSLTMKQNRLLMLLSYGLIDDDTFHIEMFSRPRPDAVPEMSGTLFMDPAPVDEVSDGSQPSAMDKQSKPKGSSMAKSSASTRKGSSK